MKKRLLFSIPFVAVVALLIWFGTGQDHGTDATFNTIDANCFSCNGNMGIAFVDSLIIETIGSNIFRIRHIVKHYSGGIVCDTSLSAILEINTQQ